MTNQSRRGTASLQGLFQSLDHEALTQVIGHRIADDPAAVEVFEAS